MTGSAHLEKVAAVLRKHGYNGRESSRLSSREVEFCDCGWRSTFAHREHVDHLAQMALDSLGLREEFGANPDARCDCGNEAHRSWCDDDCASKQPGSWLVGSWVRAGET